MDPPQMAKQKKNIQQLCEDTGFSPEDLPEAMNDREKERCRMDKNKQKMKEKIGQQERERERGNQTEKWEREDSSRKT